MFNGIYQALDFEENDLLVFVETGSRLDIFTVMAIVLFTIVITVLMLIAFQSQAFNRKNK